jgi:NAD(P)-dependent dehydrogenase (short-subunit alcohol dehydrogenase family)
MSLAARTTLAAPFRRYTLAGKSVVVSGGSRGLGLVVARELARRGARLALLARDPAELEAAREDLVGLGVAGVTIVACDVRRKDDVERALVQVVAAQGPVDVLVNIAGVIGVGPIEAMNESDFEEAMATNFWGPFHLVDAVVPGMRVRGGGRIANVSSIGGLVAVPHLLPYSASKFALTGYSLGLRAELAKDGIGVATICPGLMRTGSPRNATFKGDRAAEYAWFAAADALPGLSTSAESAARRIARAIERNEALVRITAPAKLAALAATVVPGLTSATMALTSAILWRAAPSRDATGARGGDDAPAWATALDAAAASRNNELRPRSDEDGARRRL